MASPNPTTTNGRKLIHKTAKISAWCVWCFCCDGWWWIGKLVGFIWWRSPEAHNARLNRCKHHLLTIWPHRRCCLQAAEQAGSHLCAGRARQEYSYESRIYPCGNHWRRLTLRRHSSGEECSDAHNLSFPWTEKQEAEHHGDDLVKRDWDHFDGRKK